ncbi:hypothetical protein FQ192_22625 [Pseudomonas sp. ANT_J12]|uniref:hypothetical protein n=1 Tax=Pseudomonas sp. ANT_J12 TaxID=2597351 RepID=UPI0011F12ED7|nr:hypothetical protein [Pseudomonas sp. ANT_J12]KAA0986950.1 hypothetical protein FQ192_22625 [Pseudomonas sp. ANT_J12]
MNIDKYWLQPIPKNDDPTNMFAWVINGDQEIIAKNIFFFREYDPTSGGDLYIWMAEEDDHKFLIATTYNIIDPPLVTGVELINEEFILVYGNGNESTSINNGSLAVYLDAGTKTVAGGFSIEIPLHSQHVSAKGRFNVKM